MTETEHQNGDETVAPVTPNATLAKEITNALVDAGHITDARRDEIEEGFIKGNAKSEDWRFWIEEIVLPKDDHKEGEPDVE